MANNYRERCGSMSEELPIIRQLDCDSTELWDLYQDVKRLQDLLSAYNLGLQVVDKLSNQVIELQFTIDWKD
jgi:hypothetical protein